MASYGHFVAACGFEYHGPQGYMALSPRITPDDFKAPFTCAEGWGSYRQTCDAQHATYTVSPAWGRLHMKTLAIDVPAEKKVTTADLTLAGKRIAHDVRQEGRRVTLTLEQKTVIDAGKSIEAVLGW
jgi:hypothetical protein